LVQCRILLDSTGKYGITALKLSFISNYKTAQAV